MTPIVIILIVIGAGILLLSCFLVEKSDSNAEVFTSLANERELSLTEMEHIKNKVDAIISGTTEEAIARTEDRLSQISNEKIIAVNDFSNQVIEKISQNHEEVVFLYNMLSEKESELKDTVKNIDKAKRNLGETGKNEPVKVKRKEKPQNADNKKVNEPVSETVDGAVDTEVLNNHNQKILEMYSQGFSIIDISRTLELGQGEVKLVIDLYKEK